MIDIGLEKKNLKKEIELNFYSFSQAKPSSIKLSPTKEGWEIKHLDETIIDNIQGSSITNRLASLEGVDVPEGLLENAWNDLNKGHEIENVQLLTQCLIKDHWRSKKNNQ